MRWTCAEIVGGLLLLVGTLPPGPAKPVAGQGVTVDEYEPRNTLVVPEHIITSARFPFVDIHGHQGGTRMSSEAVDRLVGENGRTQHGGHGQPVGREAGPTSSRGSKT